MEYEVKKEIPVPVPVPVRRELLHTGKEDRENPRKDDEAGTWKPDRRWLVP